MAKTAHGTLTANQVTTVNITPGEEGIVVLNRDLDGALWVRIDGVDPNPGGADTYVVLGGREFPMSRYDVRKGNVIVKLISDAARSFSVEAVQ